MENLKTGSNLRSKFTRLVNIKTIIGLVVLLGVTGGVSAAPVTPAGPAIQQPNLPSSCGSVQVPLGNKRSFNVYAQGVQVYRWNGTTWDFIAPEANLFTTPKFSGKFGIHYAGPTWESSGSKVVGARLTSCTPDSTAIPWLLLKTILNEGAGVFNKVTYIQRVNTTGGLAPAEPGSKIGEAVRIPYTAEYYFYRTGG